MSSPPVTPKLGATPYRKWSPIINDDPDSIESLFHYLKQHFPTKAQSLYCFSTFLKKRKETILQFFAHDDCLAIIKAHTPSLHSQQNITKAICIALDPVHNWSTSRGLSSHHTMWRDIFTTNARNILDMQKDLTEEKVEDISVIWNKIDDHFSALPAGDRHTEKECLMRFLTMFWPCRDDFYNTLYVDDIEKCTGSMYNYIVCKDVYNPQEPLYFVLQRGKTVKIDTRIIREIPKHLYNEDNLTGGWGLQVGKSFRYYLLHGKDDGPFRFNDVLFGVTPHSKKFSKWSNEILKLETNGFINYNRKVWENYAKEAEGVNYGKIQRYCMHTAQTAHISYTRNTN